MQCAKLHLQERSKSRIRISNEKPRRFCQKRMVNPEHEEDIRWTDIFDRFYCNDVENLNLNEKNDSETTHETREDIYLSVQNLQFQGTIEQQRRPRTSFKFKTLPNSEKHRMFVKQIIGECNLNEASPSSELSDYLDDYSKYFSNNEQSRPSSGKSSIVLYCLNDKSKENKATQVDLRREPRKRQKYEMKTKKALKNKTNLADIINNNQDKNAEDTKIAFHKNGKRKSLTISRTASPATVQVIRVDVVCNYSSSSTMSDFEENKKQSYSNDTERDQEIQMTNLKKLRCANKYMLTNTVKTLDENVPGGKVTLMCKTFKLTARSKIDSDRIKPVN